uniref:Ammonium transporter AmtB-like domain-containing protein n=1 Tax=Globodera rostochiensis TaxID=31243 RepID=A0A914H6X6_GLORO
MTATFSQYLTEALILVSPAIFLLVLLLMATVKLPHNQFCVLLGIAQLFFLVLFGLFSQHDPNAMPSSIPLGSVAASEAQRKYTDFQDVHGTLIIGFGFLVAFLRRYGFASFTISMMLTSFTLELSLLVRGFLTDEFANYGKFYVNLQNMINADYTAAVVLISFGALCGKLSPMQYLLMALIEAPFSIFNEYIIVKLLGIQDIGGALVIHVFGSVFGLVAGRVLYTKNWRESEHFGSVYHTDIFTFIATGFLWVFWPSFNATNAFGVDARNRAIVNTYTALIGSTIAAFILSSFFNKNEKFNIRHLTNASLAGGVALGACANILLSPFDALVVGVCAGTISVLGFIYFGPLYLEKKFKVTDTRGVYNLHTLPAIIGVLASSLALACYQNNAFPENSRIILPGRYKYQQALYQLAGLAITLAFASVVGAITGLILKIKLLTHIREKEVYCDADFFEVPEDYDFTTRVTSHIDHVELTETRVASEHKPLVGAQKA